MEKLTAEQKNRLIEHMKRYEDDSWASHILWAMQQFGIRLTEQECMEAFMSAIY